MAKYDVVYGCGHEGEMQLFGPEKDRQRKIEWYKKTDCPECYIKNQMAEAMQTADEFGELPELLGSKKQIDWATSLRIKKLIKLKPIAQKAEENLVTLKERLLDPEVLASYTPDELQKAADQITRSNQDVIDEYNAALTETSARWWIDNR